MMHFLNILALAWLGAAAAVSPSASESPTELCEAAGAEPAQPPAASAGLKVVVDPETGEIVDRPTRKQLQRLSEGLAPRQRPDSRELREFALPGGGQGVFLDGWADQSLAVEISAEGLPESTCSASAAPNAVERAESESR